MKKQTIEKLIELNDSTTKTSIEIGILLELNEKQKERQTEVSEKNKINKLKINVYIDNKRTTINISKSLIKLYFLSSYNLSIRLENKIEKSFARKNIKKIVKLNNSSISKSINKTESIEELLINLIIDYKLNQ